MRYGELIDGKLILAPRKLHVDGFVVYNPPKELLEANGYKPVRYTEAPETEDGYIAVPGWAEAETEIVQVWRVEEEPDEVDGEMAMEILFGGDG